MVRKLAFAALVMASVGCFRPSSPESIAQGDGWSFQTPASWQFHLTDSGIGIIGSSPYSVGSRPMIVTMLKSCGADAQVQFENSKNLGHGTKWMGGRLGVLEATKLVHTHPDGSSTIFYVAKIQKDQCVWTLSCQGDAVESGKVDAVCHTMLNSLEFHQ